MHYEEAWKHLNEILSIYEREFGEHDTATADCMFTNALVTYKRNHTHEALDDMQRCLMIYTNTLGEYDNKTREVEETIRSINQYLKQAEQ